MRGLTFTLRPSEFDCRNTGKIPLFCFSLFSLSLSLSLSDFSYLPCLLPFLFFFSFLLFFHFLIHHTSFSPCLFLSHFHFPFFSHFLMLFFLFAPLSSFSYPYGSSGGNFPPLSSLATCHHHVFLPYFLYFLFPFYYIM